MAFGGFGRHLANDFLHEVRIHPLLSPFAVCSDSAMWGRLVSTITPYMMQWRSPNFVRKCCVEVNSLNPFTFNGLQEHNYHSEFIRVHAKTSVRLSITEYNCFVGEGLLDPNHIIGVSRVIACLVTSDISRFAFVGQPYTVNPLDLAPDVNGKGWLQGC